MRIGINPISWTNDDLPALGGETSLETALTEGKAIGYEGFELGNKFPRGCLQRRCQFQTAIPSRSVRRSTQAYRRLGHVAAFRTPGTAGLRV